MAVKNVNVRVQRSEFVCILGHSGCGKSTVLSIIAGLQRATEGGVCINGRETITPGPDRGVVFQTPSLLPWLTVRDNVSLAVGQKFSKLSRSARQRHADKYLDLVGGGEAAGRLPGGKTVSSPWVRSSASSADQQDNGMRTNISTW